jgi:hypothetical protein
MGLMKSLLDHLDFDATLQLAALPQPSSNRSYPPEQLIVQFMLSIWCEANQFEHTEVTRHDPVLKRLFGFEHMANFKAIICLFRKVSQADYERVAHTLYNWQFRQLDLDGLTLDLDSTVMTRHGAQQGATTRRSQDVPRTIHSWPS